MITVPASRQFEALKALPLPVFRQDEDEYCVFYAPGFVTVVDAGHGSWMEAAVRSVHATTGHAPDRYDTLPPAGAAEAAAVALVAHARRAMARREALLDDAFAPLCLMLCVGDRCNLRCVYCYAEPAPGGSAVLSRSHVRTAAEVVAANCRRAGRPLVLVVHGGGEPGLHRSVVQEALDEVSLVAAGQGVQTFRYVATNGVLPAATATWLAQAFDLIGLSCDGPADIQSAQRPTRAGRPATAALERSAAAIRASARLHVRLTVTPSSLDRLAESVVYVCRRLRPAEIHVEPQYRGGRARPEDGFVADDAPAFADRLFAARALAGGYGVPVVTAGNRLSEIHGPFCQILRSVLQITPGGAVSTCFKHTGPTRGPTTIGRCTATGHVLLDEGRIAGLRRRLRAWPDDCLDCFSRFHCTLGCPDVCPATDDPAPSAGTGARAFRCALVRELAGRTLLEVAATTWRQARRPPPDAAARRPGTDPTVAGHPLEPR